MMYHTCVIDHAMRHSVLESSFFGATFVDPMEEIIVLSPIFTLIFFFAVKSRYLHTIMNSGEVTSHCFSKKIRLVCNAA